MDQNKMITIYINGQKHEVEDGQMIMQAADKLGYKIPRLCYLPKLSLEGSCRVCIVEVEGIKNFAASCTFPVRDGMRIHTDTTAVRQARRDIVELILDNHPIDCHTCERNGNCELQRLSYAMGIHARHFEGERKKYEVDNHSPAIVRNPNKCILCGRCVRVCSEVQGIHTLGYAHRGFKTVVMPAFNTPLEESVCSTCGQCINVCPTAAFVENSQAQEVFLKLDNPDLVKVVQVAPAVRAAIGEAFGAEPGRVLHHEIVAVLRAMGFNYVFDTQFSADLTIMEEGTELLERVQSKQNLPMITSCSPSWIKSMEQFYPEMIPNISTCKSPMSMLGALAKTYFAKKINRKPEEILSVAVMPCTAKKFEASRKELFVNGLPAVDHVITTRELAWMIKSAGINLLTMEGSSFDSPLGLSSGAGTIFGFSGGVMEAALRTAYELYTGETLMNIEFESIRGLKGIKEASVNAAGLEIRCAVAHGLSNAYHLLNEVKENPGKYHFIEIMGCPGGCIGGGGQPYASSNSRPYDEAILQKRASALMGIDRTKTIRRSHDNPEIQRLYKEFLGRPASQKSHELLHTHYTCKQPKGIFVEE